MTPKEQRLYDMAMRGEQFKMSEEERNLLHSIPEWAGCSASRAQAVRFVDAADFIAETLPPPQWIVEDFIALGMKGDLCGSSKSFKTYLGLQLAVSIASGRDFLGAFKVTKPHIVAYANLELLDWNFQERIKAQTAAQRWDEDEGEMLGGLGIDREELRGRLFVGNLRGRAATLRDCVGEVVAQLNALGVELVIIDPRYKLIKPGEDENTGEGLRGILEFRDELAKHFAVLVVTHDPKGDTSQKKTTDRGAGSYTAGADFDFRLTVDRAEGWTKENLVYVIDSEGRARKTPAPIGARFDGCAQIFRVDEKVEAVKMDARNTARANATTRAASETALQGAYKRAALSVVEKAGGDLLDVRTFDNAVATAPGASVGMNRRADMRKSLVSQGVLATCPQLERKDSTGEVGNVKNGCTYISTPELINAYRAKFDALGL